MLEKIKLLNITRIKFILLFSLLNIVVYNIPVYQYSMQKLELSSDHSILIFLSITVSLFAISSFLFLIISSILPKFLMKPFFIIIIFCNAIALYFINTYNVILDKTMMGNLLNTNITEALSYYEINIVLYILLVGIIPSFIIYRINLTNSKRLHMIGIGFVIIISSVGILYINSPTWLWFDKHAKILGALTLPWSYSINTIRYKLKEINNNQTRENLPDATFLNDEKKLVVLIIGESARAASFSLYGYDKQTNPNLEKLNIRVLKNSKATTTYTTASIHSMLSYQASTSDSFEILPNYLERQGVDVLWRANNWGQPRLNIKNYEKAGSLKKHCITKDCDFDEVLLTNLQEKISTLKKKKKFVVLHTEGSHGPSYYKKYPKSFEFFKPVCKSVDISSCTQKELINAYDNSILYTDYVISQTIKTLKQIDIPSVLIYISDHGESLGEFGLYLHGTPYSIAPDFQKEIPFILWESDNSNPDKTFQQTQLSTIEEYGHFNIFHTILGALDMKSKIYNKKLDILQKNKGIK